MKTKVSVIVPVYNVDPYLRICLDSVLSQTLNEIEVICINDGSIDKSQEILNEYAWRDPRVHVINQVNQGVAIARNRGIDVAKGEFLCFMDPDDYYPDQDVLENLYLAATQNDVLICGGGFEENRVGELLDKWTGNLSQYSFPKDDIVTYRNYQFEYGFQRFIYKTSFIKGNRFYFPILSYYEDPVFFVRCMSKAQKFYGLSRVTYSYRTGHKTRTWTCDAVSSLLKGLIEVLKIAKADQYTDLLALEEARILNDYLNPICDALLNNPGKELIGLMDSVTVLLYDGQKKIENFIFKNKIDHLVYDYCVERDALKLQRENLQAELQESKKEYEDLAKKFSIQDNMLKESSAENQNHRILLEEYKLKNQNLEKKMINMRNAFYASKDWKIGNFLLKLPRMVKKLVRKGNHTHA